MDHLSIINDYKDKFCELLSENRSYVEIARIFHEDTGIDCSTQAGRKGVQKLKAKYFNAENGQEEDILCELHTKFNRFNINREEQDRIYFFLGRKGIKGGKIIVKHIGTHL